MKKSIVNVPASVQGRLRNLARDRNRPYNELLQYFAIERFLYRLSKSRFEQSFTLKGALMLHVWDGLSSRPTRDIDLSARGDSAVDSQVEIIGECLNLEVPEDGVRFDLESLSASEILIAAKYNGVRLSCNAYIGKARLVVKVDVGFGDVVKPAPVRIVYPSLLDFAEPCLWGYTPEALVAEKFHAMVIRDLNNTRMKDFYDVWSLAVHREFSGLQLMSAIEATFQRRDTKVPGEIPVAFTEAFYGNSMKQIQWAAFLRKARLGQRGLEIAGVCATLQRFLMPPVEAIVRGVVFDQSWVSSGPWRSPAAKQ